MKRFLSLLLIAAPLAAQTSMTPPVETISVTGIGKTTLTPDRFTFTASVQTTAPTVEEAVNQNNTKMTNVIAALKKAGATDQEVRTSNFSIYPQQVYEQGQAPRVVGYQATNSLTVTKKDIASAGRLLQVALSEGVNETSGLNFEVSDPARGRDQGLRSAYEDAKAQATLLAQAAGRTLGRALTINAGIGNEISPPPRPMPAQVMAGKAAAVSYVPVESGARDVSYTISVVFELR